MSIGRCNDCGHPYTVYRWERGPLAGAMCPIHKTPLARTTMPKDTRRVVDLSTRPGERGTLYLQARRGREPWRLVRDVVLVAGLALGAGCAEVRVPTDAAASDAAPTPSGCFTLRNTLETRAPACPWRDWGCPLSGLETEAEVAACNERLYTAGSDCVALEATLAECAR